MSLCASLAFCLEEARSVSSNRIPGLLRNLAAHSDHLELEVSESLSKGPASSQTSIFQLFPYYPVGSIRGASAPWEDESSSYSITYMKRCHIDQSVNL